MRHLPVLFLTSLAAPAAAGDLVLDWPVDCVLGDTCQIQQYVDHDAGPGARDFLCAGLSYDGHKGTDIALPFLTDMHAGVKVLAAADGVVAGFRDGMADRYATDANAAEIGGRECGNGVVLRHGDGWETQYCHMKLGSVQVEKGARVTVGTVLGEIGLSGMTQFPHLHLSVRKDGQVVDPFAPAMDSGSCNADGADYGSLWRDTPDYAPGGFLGGGFSDAVPSYNAIRSGSADAAPLPATAPALVYWAYVFGGRKDDQLVITVDGPQGRVVEQAEPLEKAQAQFFRAAGRRMRSGLPAGSYTGRAVLLRSGEEVDRIEQQMVVE